MLLYISRIIIQEEIWIFSYPLEETNLRTLTQVQSRITSMIISQVLTFTDYQKFLFARCKLITMNSLIYFTAIHLYILIICVTYKLELLQVKQVS
jgi:hypothetical protein